MGKVFAGGCALAFFLAGCGGSNAASDPTARTAPTHGTATPRTTPANAESLSPITPTDVNAPCRQIVFLGRTYVPAPHQPGIGVGGILTADGRYRPTGRTAKGRGLECGEHAVMQIDVYSAPEESVRDELAVNGYAVGNTGVWEYVNKMLVD